MVVPIGSTVVPKWKLQVVDVNGIACSNMRVTQSWGHYSLYIGGNDQTDDRFTDSHGNVEFPERTIRAGLARRLVVPVIAHMLVIAHGSVGPSGAVWASGIKDVAWLSYTPGRPLPDKMLVEKCVADGTEQIVGRERNQRACHRQLVRHVVVSRRVNSTVRRLTLDMTKRTVIAFVSLLFVASVSHGQSPVAPDTVITLQRLADAFGYGTDYKLTIKSDGTVTFKRFASPFVDRSDPRACEATGESKISTETVAMLVSEFERVKFFSLRDRYAENEDGCPGGVWTDAPAAEISITVNGKSKTIFHYYGCLDQNRRTYPADLVALAAKIDELVNTKQWLK